MEYYLSFAKNFTTISLAFVFAGIGFRKYQNLSIIDASNFSKFGGLSANETDIMIMGAGFFLMAAVIRIFINRYPLRIYKRETDYVAIFEGQLPRMTKKLYYRKGDVIEQPPSGIMPWQDSRYKINGSKVIMLINYFKSPSELHQMLR